MQAGWFRAGFLAFIGTCASDGASDPVVVRIFNAVGVPSSTVAEATRLVDEVYGRAGISIKWMTGDARTLKALEQMTPQRAGPGCPSVSVINVRLGLMPLGERSATLARAYPYYRDGIRVSVGMERVYSYAQDSRTRVHRVLGLVLAHEIGHVLKGTDGHSSVGLMRPQLQSERFGSAAADDALFHAVDLALIHENLRVAAGPLASCGHTVGGAL
jgi:hypothetical protein